MGGMARHSPRGAADELAVGSQRLLDAVLNGDVEGVDRSLEGGGKLVDVNYVGGAVNLRVKCSETLLREENPDDVRIVSEEFRTDVTPLFAASHSGHYEIVRKLLSAGADVNQELFRGYATTAAAREGHHDILDLLLKAGASQSACEDALLEASLCGEAQSVGQLICSDMIRPDAAVHALVTACCRGFVDVVTTLIKNGVDVNCMDRVLLRSVKPVLHANVDCTPLVAAVVSRQLSVVKFLLEAGANIDCNIRVGAWSWDPISGEELRVGACLGEAYNAAWCAVEYFEASGEILRLLLRHKPSLLETTHLGRTLICHAVLCQNANATTVLLDLGANYEFPMKTSNGNKLFPLHLAAKLGCVSVLKLLISRGCDVDVFTACGETPLMIAAKADDADCFQELLLAGADMGIVSSSGDTAIHLAKRSAFASSIVSIFSQVGMISAGIFSSDLKVFSPLHFAAASGNIELINSTMRSFPENLNKLDSSGFTPVMVALTAGHVDAFRLLVMAGAELMVEAPDGKTVISLLQVGNFSGDKLSFEQILLDAVLANIVTNRSAFKAMHYAAKTGDTSSLVQLLKMGFDVNLLDDNGYSPLMYAAREGHPEVCKLLLCEDCADCALVNRRGETALSLARSSSKSNKAVEGVLLDHLARSHILSGMELMKHTREGRGSPHLKTVRMLKTGLLSWGKSNRRNVVCKEATAGASLNFLKNQRKISINDKRLIFRVVTVTGRQVHFEAGSTFSLELWVRGINLIVKEISSGP